MNLGTTLTTLAAIVAGALGIDTQGQTSIKAVIAALVGLVVVSHTLVTYFAHQHANTSAVKVAQAHAGGSALAAVLVDVKNIVTGIGLHLGTVAAQTPAPAPATPPSPAEPSSAVAAAPGPDAPPAATRVAL